MEDYDIKQELRADLFFLLLILVMFIGGIAAYPYLPESIAIHWNLQGEADSAVSKVYGAFLLPLIGLAIYLYSLIRPLANQKEPLERLRRNRRTAVAIITLVQIGVLVINL